MTWGWTGPATCCALASCLGSLRAHSCESLYVVEAYAEMSGAQVFQLERMHSLPVSMAKRAA